MNIVDKFLNDNFGVMNYNNCIQRKYWKGIQPRGLSIAIRILPVLFSIMTTIGYNPL